MYSELLMSRLLTCDCCDLKDKARTTKHAILVAALELFMVNGFMKTPVREICLKAGVAKGTFYLYFETKENVLLNLFDLLYVELDVLVMVLDAKNPSLLQIDDVIDKAVILMEKEKAMLRFMHSPEIMLFVGDEAPNQLFGAMESSIKEWLISAIDKGVVSSEITVLSFEIIFNIIHDTLEKSLMYVYPADIKEVAFELKKLLRNMLT